MARQQRAEIFALPFVSFVIFCDNSVRGASGEAAPVLLRRNPEALHEGATKTVGIVKPDRGGNAFDATICGSKPVPSFIET